MTPNPQYPGQQPAGAVPQGKSGLAIAAFIVALLGLPLLACLGAGLALEFVALGLAIAALVQISKNPGLGGRGFAITGIVLPLTVYVVGLSAAAIFLPNIKEYQARGKQSECKSNLNAIYTGERSLYEEKQVFSTNVNEIGFSPERGNRYAYFLFDVGQMQDRTTARTGDGPGVTGVSVDAFRYPNARPISYGDLTEPVAGGVKAGVHGQCPECSFVSVCAGNLDSDETLDVWSISSVERTSKTGESIPAGVPFNDVSDVKD